MTLDLIVGPLARLLSILLYRRIEVRGRENVPAEGSILVIANHENNLVDPMLLLAFTGLRPRFLAKHTLFRHPLVRHLVNLVRAVPVYRREDGVDPRRNETTLHACARALAAGDTIGIFPEGGCHNRPSRPPLKTGAARIAIDATRLREDRRVCVLPIGLYYTAKSRFRSSVAIVIGAPFPVCGDMTPHTLTAAMTAGLELVTQNAPSWEVSDSALRCAEGRAGAREVSPGPLERFDRQREALAEMALRPGVAESDVGETTAAWADLPKATPNVLRALLLTPPALVGMILSGTPLVLTLFLSRERGRTPDEPATRRLIGTILFFPPMVAGQSLLIGHWAGLWIGVGALLATPAFLLVLLLCVDAWSDVGRSLRRRLL